MAVTSSLKWHVYFNAIDVDSTAPNKSVNNQIYQTPADKRDVRNGSTAGKIDGSYAAVETLGAGASITVDLQALLKDNGETIDLESVEEIIIENQGTGDLLVGNAASNQWSEPFGAAVDTASVPANDGLFLWSDPAGATVDATHSDLKFASTAGTTFLVILVGRKA